MQQKNPNIEILGEYVDDKTKIKCKCRICNNVWEDSPTHLKLDRGCPSCKKLEKLEKIKLDYINRVTKIHKYKYDYSLVQYVNQHTKIKIICPIHGEFLLQAQAHLRGEGCPDCSIQPFKKYTVEDFITLANKVHNNKYNYSKVLYNTCKDKVCIICSKHGEFWQTPDNHIRGKGCPKCTLKSLTTLYEKLKSTFPNEEILFEVGNSKVPWLLNQRFDIYFPKYNIAIEYNGIQHYIPIEHFGGEIKFEEILERDKLKLEKCQLNNCTLLEIKYDYSETDYSKLIEKINTIIKRDTTR